MKEIKLIKVGEHYDLYHRIAEENLIIGFASTDNTFVNKLSLKNCQKIERGYDLDELSKEKYPYEKTEMFSCFELDCKQEGVIQSLQQTEWYVEIMMDILNEYDQPKLDTDGCLILSQI